MITRPCHAVMECGKIFAMIWRKINAYFVNGIDEDAKDWLKIQHKQSQIQKKIAFVKFYRSRTVLKNCPQFNMLPPSATMYHAWRSMNTNYITDIEQRKKLSRVL